MLGSCLLVILLDNMFVLTRSKDLILNRHNLRYKSSVVALSSSLQANPTLSSNIASQGFLSSTGTLICIALEYMRFIH